ncbi:mucin-2-like [Liolophura sinensis]|uniref:mucin-2-like n=1 Tax=Liolophura sinensis TaxID=3198878 RepID=UPI0031592716
MYVSAVIWVVLTSGALCLENSNNNETPVQPDTAGVETNTNPHAGEEVNQTLGERESVDNAANAGGTPIHPSGGQHQVPLFQHPGQLNPNRQEPAEGHERPDVSGLHEGHEPTPSGQQPGNSNGNSSTAHYLHSGPAQTNNPVLVIPVTLAAGGRNLITASHQATPTEGPVEMTQRSLTVTARPTTEPQSSRRPSAVPTSLVPVGRPTAGATARTPRDTQPPETLPTATQAPIVPDILMSTLRGFASTRLQGSSESFATTFEPLPDSSTGSARVGTSEAMNAQIPDMTAELSNSTRMITQQTPLPVSIATEDPNVTNDNTTGLSQTGTVLTSIRTTAQATGTGGPGPTEEKTLDPRDNETVYGDWTTPSPGTGGEQPPTEVISPTPSSSWTTTTSADENHVDKPVSSSSGMSQGSAVIPSRSIPSVVVSPDPLNTFTVEETEVPVDGYTHLVVTPTEATLQPSQVVEVTSEITFSSSLKSVTKISDKLGSKTTSLPVLSRTYDISPSTSMSTQVIPTTIQISTTETFELTTPGILPTAGVSEESPEPTAEAAEVSSADSRNGSEMVTAEIHREVSENVSESSAYNNTEEPELTTVPKTTLFKLLISSLSPDSSKVVTIPKTTLTTGGAATTVSNNTTEATTSASGGIPPSAPTLPPNTDPPLYIKLGLEMTWNDFCQSHSHFLRELVEVIGVQAGKVIHERQVIFLDQEQRECRSDPVQVSEDIMIRLYISDQDGQYNAVLTEEVGQVIQEGFNAISNSRFKDKVKEVRLVRKQSPSETQPSVEPVEPGVTIAIVIASVGGVCCVAVLLLQVVLRRRHGRKMTAFVPGTRQFSIRSVDSIALNRVKSRPHSGFYNPGLESGEVVTKSLPVNFAGLANFSADVEPLYEQFQLLPSNTPSLSDVPVGCEEKNRYANVLPFPETRVRLSIISKDPTCDYINANYITGYKEKSRAYIATQAPLKCTIVDFWRMMWEQQSRAIIMLTPLEEHGLSKCAEYWPDTEGVDTKRLYGDYQVELKKKEIRPEYIISTLVLKYMDRNLTREIKHLWFTNWPQSNNPDPITLIHFIQEIRPFYEEHTSPVVVHCSPGTGRTGTLIAIDICMRMYKDTRTVDILKCVSEMRHERAGVVQTREQYALIYKALNEYAVQLSSPTPSKASSSISLHTL